MPLIFRLRDAAFHTPPFTHTPMQHRRTRRAARSTPSRAPATALYQTTGLALAPHQRPTATAHLTCHTLQHAGAPNTLYLRWLAQRPLDLRRACRLLCWALERFGWISPFYSRASGMVAMAVADLLIFSYQEDISPQCHYHGFHSPRRRHLHTSTIPECHAGGTHLCAILCLWTINGIQRPLLNSFGLPGLHQPRAPPTPT